MAVEVLKDVDICIAEEIRTGRWEVFLLRVDAEVYARVHEFLFKPRPGVFAFYTSMMLDQDQPSEGKYMMCFRDAPGVAMEFKLAFNTEHQPRGELPSNYHFDLRVDPATPVQTLSVDPLRGEGLY